jgi:hypothetical protein
MYGIAHMQGALGSLMDSLESTRKVARGSQLLKCFLRLCVVFSPFISLILSGCEQKGLERPYGYIKLGKIDQFIGRRTFLTRDRLLIRRDEQGLSVMSTLCTYDLSPLTPQTTAHGIRFVSQYSTSTYDISGVVLRGPAQVTLPYYELRLASEDETGVRDTLYVYVGKHVSPSWRLPMPSGFGSDTGE